MSALRLPDPDLRALAGGESILAFTEASPGSEVELAPAGPRSSEELKPAYRRWAEAGPPPGRWRASVEAVHSSERIDPEKADPRHILLRLADGPLAVLRVRGPDGPVLSDEAFGARLRSFRQALRE